MCCRDNNDFLPVAIILGLTPGETLTVPITILAEDGVTSSVYHVDILRTSAAEGALSAKSLDLGSGSGLGPAVALSLTGISSSKGGSQDAGIPPPPRTQSTEPLDTLPAGKCTHACNSTSGCEWMLPCIQLSRK